MTRPSGVIERPKIEVNGTALAVDLLNLMIDLRVESTVSRPAQAVLRFIDDEFSILDDTKMTIGAEVKVSFVDIKDGKPSSIFVGEVTSLGVEAGPDDVPITVVTAQDLAHRLGRGSRQRVFANQTYSDMIKKILGENGLQAKVAALTTVFEHFTQTVDDASFIDEICRRTGMIWTMAGKQFDLHEPALSSPVVKLVRGESLRRFRAQFDSAEVAESVAVRSWDPKAKQEIVSTSTKQPDGLSNNELVRASRKSAAGFKASKATGSNVTASLDEAKGMAAALHARSMSDELRVRGEADGDPSIVAGCTVEIEKVGKKLSGRYFVTAADHVYSGRDYVTRFTCGGVRPATLADLVGGGSA
ncbi:MAG: contractile injection system protein, VgrG/Pvc8 family, partial [Ilumatobacteraceae bacterium]